MITKIKRKALQALASIDLVGAHLRTRHAARGVSVFMYHDIGPDQSAGEAWQVVRESDFRAQLDFISSNYQVRTLDDALASFDDSGHSTKPCAVLTFDDGLKGNVERLLPILEAYQAPATIYIATRHIQDQRCYWFDRIVNSLQSVPGPALDLSRFGLGHHNLSESLGLSRWSAIQKILERTKRLPQKVCDEVADVVAQQAKSAIWTTLAPLQREDVVRLSRSPLITIGAHSHGHEILTLLSEREVKRTLIECVSLLEAWTGKVPKHFAYPSGIHNGQVERAVQSIGFLSGASTRPGLWRSVNSRFQIPRISVGRYDSVRQLAATSAIACLPFH